MQPESIAPVRPVIPAMRWVLLAGCVLVFLAGLQLYVFSTHTYDYFAWTISAPLTAAFLGAFYWTAGVLAFFSSREPTWVRARIGVGGVFLFVTLTLVTTLLHTDRFHFNNSEGTATVAAWAWLLTYIVEPVVLLLAIGLQLRTPGIDPSAVRDQDDGEEVRF